MQNRQKAPARGSRGWLLGAARSAHRTLGMQSSALAVTEPASGLAQVEALHACLADGLGRLREAFGDVLSKRMREATFYADLRDIKLDCRDVAQAMVGG
jgi:hypothetical protein